MGTVTDPKIVKEVQDSVRIPSTLKWVQKLKEHRQQQRTRQQRHFERQQVDETGGRVDEHRTERRPKNVDKKESRHDSRSGSPYRSETSEGIYITIIPHSGSCNGVRSGQSDVGVVMITVM